MEELPGGDSVCWLHRVCPECGLFLERPQEPLCPRCGAAVGDDDEA
ncbi:MAG: hypothetical protein LBE25_08190 [Arthrobacter sp.]|nr:hypothetical protein [Arthrobacter sp.]